MVTTEAIRKEILDDARKKAEHLLREAEEELARAKAAGEAEIAAAVELIRTSSEQRVKRSRAETLARIPLEKTRMKTAFVDAKIREAMDRFMAGFPEARVLGLVEGLLAGSAPYFAGKEVHVGYRGISAASVKAFAARCLPGATISAMAEDASLPAAGLAVETSDGKLSARATLDLVEEQLLSRRRGELARALCAEALTI
jgi:V/A-type H+-transporting ATPase subunit E